MLMRVLSLGGVDIEYSPSRDALKEKFRNPYGMFEMPNPSYTKCVKCTSPSRVMQFPEGVKIIYITRDPEQQAKSWDRITGRVGLNIKRVKKVRELFTKFMSDKPHLHIAYEDMIADPKKECERIREYLGEFNVEEAVKAVDKGLFIIR
jgi:hypothetical protein